jgi:hypothetical protein
MAAEMVYRGMWQQAVKCKGALCSDGKRRTVIITSEPERFRLPVKYGMYESSAITNSDANQWHRAEDCPLNQEGTNN